MILSWHQQRLARVCCRAYAAVCAAACNRRVCRPAGSAASAVRRLAKATAVKRAIDQPPPAPRLDLSALNNLRLQSALPIGGNGAKGTPREESRRQCFPASAVACGAATGRQMQRQRQPDAPAMTGPRHAIFIAQESARVRSIDPSAMMLMWFFTQR
jgi:hypothetical protein